MKSDAPASCGVGQRVSEQAQWLSPRVKPKKGGTPGCPPHAFQTRSLGTDAGVWKNDPQRDGLAVAEEVGKQQGFQNLSIV